MVTIDLKHVNESAPYALRLAPYAQLSYILTTDYGVNYTLSFMPSDLMPEIEAYEFAISNTNHRKSPRDPKLRQSILTLVYEFFRTREAVMLYLCETGDNRQKHRSPPTVRLHRPTIQRHNRTVPGQQAGKHRLKQKKPFPACPIQIKSVPLRPIIPQRVQSSAL